MTSEQRDNLVKLVAKEAEKARTAIRNHRQNVLKDLKKASDGGSQDDAKRLEKTVPRRAGPAPPVDQAPRPQGEA